MYNPVDMPAYILSPLVMMQGGAGDGQCGSGDRDVRWTRDTEFTMKDKVYGFPEATDWKNRHK